MISKLALVPVQFTQSPDGKLWSDAESTTGILVKRKSLTPAAGVSVATSSVAPATVITTDAPHGFTTGDETVIAGHTGATPSLNGTHVVTVLSPTTFSIPVAVTVAGADGTAGAGFITIAELRSVGPGGKSRNKLDTSTHNDGSESSQLGMLRQKDPTMKINYVRGKPSHVILSSDIDNNVKATWQFAFPSGFTRTGDARVQAMDYDDAPVDAIQGASITLVWAGVVVESTAA